MSLARLSAAIADRVGDPAGDLHSRKVTQNARRLRPRTCHQTPGWRDQFGFAPVVGPAEDPARQGGTPTASVLCKCSEFQRAPLANAIRCRHHPTTRV